MSLLIATIPLKAEHLKAEISRAESSASRWLGRAAQAWLLNEVRHVDPVLANWLHKGTQERRPYTVTWLPDGDRKVNYGLAETLILSGNLILTSLHAELTALISEAILPQTDPIRLANFEFQRSERLHVELSSFEALAQASFNQASELESQFIRFDFVTPTAFHRGGATLPLPIPALIFGSLIQAWNTFSLVGLPIVLGPFIEQNVNLIRHHIRTRLVHISKEEKRIGFTGFAEFKVSGKKLIAQQVDEGQVNGIQWQTIDLLTQFAKYAGVGIRTTVGMGHVVGTIITMYHYGKCGANRQ